MDKNISGLEPKNVWKHFHAITQIPHPSNHEEEIKAFFIEFAKKNKLAYIADEVGNVIISKPATKGMENKKGIVLQAHMDMVPQKNSDSKFDFTKDPICAYIDGDWVTADGTTLGADNGVGLAAMLAVLESNTLKHGLVEALITATEETGMNGAFGLKKGLLKGDILLNLDSETEGELYVGCAGGIDATIKLKLKTQEVDSTFKAFEIAMTGLKGGHSGMDIILGRGNANKLMNRLLIDVIRNCSARICCIKGGSLRNAIPRESFVTIFVPENKAERLQKRINAFFTETAAELALVEPEYSVIFKEVKDKKKANVLTQPAARKLCNVVYSIPNGVVRMSDSMNGLVETSSNMAIITLENGEVSISCLLRSSVDTAKMDLAQAMKSVTALAGGKIELTGEYPGWQPNMKSPILKAMQDTYYKLYKKKAEIMAIHAGLECGLLGGVYKNWDMISFGPTIMYPHSPDEKVHIKSVGKFWDYLVAVLENAPAK